MTKSTGVGRGYRPLKPAEHGTRLMYDKRKCRCDLCKEAHREYNAKNRAERLASGRLTHGTRSAYDAGCRCVNCTCARSARIPRENSERRRKNIERESKKWDQK